MNFSVFSVFRREVVKIFVIVIHDWHCWKSQTILTSFATTLCFNMIILRGPVDTGREYTKTVVILSLLLDRLWHKSQEDMMTIRIVSMKSIFRHKGSIMTFHDDCELTGWCWAKQLSGQSVKHFNEKGPWQLLMSPVTNGRYFRRHGFPWKSFRWRCTHSRVEPELLQTRFCLPIKTLMQIQLLDVHINVSGSTAVAWTSRGLFFFMLDSMRDVATINSLTLLPTSRSDGPFHPLRSLPPFRSFMPNAVLCSKRQTVRFPTWWKTRLRSLRIFFKKLVNGLGIFMFVVVPAEVLAMFSSRGLFIFSWKRWLKFLLCWCPAKNHEALTERSLITLQPNMLWQVTARTTL